MRKNISVVLDDSDIEKLKSHCDSTGMNMSVQVRVWIKEKLSQTNVDLNKFRGGE